MTRHGVGFICGFLVMTGAPAAGQDPGWRVDFEVRSRAGPDLEPNFVVAQGLIIASGSDGSIAAFDLTTGEPRWRYQVGSAEAASGVSVTDERSISGGIAVGMAALRRRIRLGAPMRHGDVVYVVSSHVEPPEIPNVYALDAATGAVRWSFFAPDGTYSRPVSLNDRVLVTGERFLYALDASTSEERWRFEPLAGLHEFARRPPHRPILEDGTLYLTVWPTHQGDTPHNSYFHAVDAVGARLWTVEVSGSHVTAPVLGERLAYFAFEVGGELREIEVDGRPVVTRGEVHVAVRAVTRDSGTVVWEARVDSTGGNIRLVASGGVVCVASGRGVAAFNAATGDGLWSFEPDGHMVAIYVGLSGEKLVVPTQEALHVLSLQSGDVMHTLRLPDDGWFHLLDGTSVYVSRPDRLARYDVSTGRRLWEARLDSRAHTVEVVDGWVYVATTGDQRMGREPKPGSLYKLDVASGKWR